MALVFSGIYWTISATTAIFDQALCGASRVTHSLVGEGPENGGLSLADQISAKVDRIYRRLSI